MVYENLQLISCVIHHTHIQLMYRGCVFPPFPRLIAPPRCCNMSRNCSCVCAKLCFDPKVTTELMTKHSLISGAELWLLTLTSVFMRSISNLHHQCHPNTALLCDKRPSPCCRDFFTCGYWDSVGSDCRRVPSSIKSNISSWTISWNTKQQRLGTQKRQHCTKITTCWMNIKWTDYVDPTQPNESDIAYSTSYHFKCLIYIEQTRMDRLSNLNSMHLCCASMFLFR